MEKKGNIFEAPFEGLANIMAKQEAFCDDLFAALCKKCVEHKEYMLVLVVTVLSVVLFFLITTDILSSFLELVFTGILIAVSAIALVVGRSSDYWQGYMDGRNDR